MHDPANMYTLPTLNKLERVRVWVDYESETVYQVKNKAGTFLLLTVGHLFWYRLQSRKIRQAEEYFYQPQQEEGRSF